LPVSNAVAVSLSATHILEWLAISLTPGLGPTKARKLIEHFGSAEAVFHASLTELESTGMQAVSAQSIATEKSAELAREEIARAAAAGVTVISLEDPCYPPRLKEIYDPPLVLYVRGNPEVLTQPASPWWARVIPRRTAQGWRSGWHAFSQHRDW
jgi:DNA processing protein